MVAKVHQVRKLGKVTSHAHTRRKIRVGSLLTKAYIADWMYTATAVHEDEAKRNPNGAWRESYEVAWRESYEVAWRESYEVAWRESYEA